MTYTEIIGLRNSTTLKQKAAVAVITIANYVVNYTLSGTSPAIVGVSMDMLNNAQHAREDPLGAAEHFMWEIALDSTIQSEGEAATDAHVHAVVNAKYQAVWG